MDHNAKNQITNCLYYTHVNSFDLFVKFRERQQIKKETVRFCYTIPINKRVI